jgi:hypothetical protein
MNPALEDTSVAIPPQEAEVDPERHGLAADPLTLECPGRENRNRQISSVTLQELRYFFFLGVLRLHEYLISISALRSLPIVFL